MRKVELIDKIQIGTLKFQAFILEDEHQLEAFAVYVDEVTEPLILFQQQDAGKLIDVKVYPEQVEYLQSKNAIDDPEAKDHYRRLQDFVLNSENTAKDSVFKDKKLEYLTDVNLIKRIKQAFHIHED